MGKTGKTKFIGPLLATDNLRAVVSEEEIKKAGQAASNWHTVTFPEFELRFKKNFSDGCLSPTIKIVDGNFEEVEARHLFFKGKTVETTARRVPDEDDKTQKLLTSGEK